MKITLIAKHDNYCNDSLVKAARARGAEIEMINFNNIQKALEFHNWGDIIIWRSSNLNKKDDRYILFEYLNQQKKIILNIGQREGAIYSKYSQQYKVFNYLQKHKFSLVRGIPTFRFNNLDQLKSNTILNFPIVEKPDEGTRGNGVRLINSYDDIYTIDKTKIYQKYINNDGDYRIICLGGVVLGIIKRIARKGDIRNNVSQGASIDMVQDIATITELSNIALQISTIFNLNLCGVDIIYDKDANDYKFLEVNSVVWWEGFESKTEINVADEIIKHCITLYKRNNLLIEDLVKDYYDGNFEHLLDKRFHFASRMYLFFQDISYKKRLLDLQSNYIGKDDIEINIVINKILEENKIVSVEYKNENEIRSLILEEYPNLGKYNAVLAKYLFSLKIYNKDISSNILKNIKLEKLIEYYCLLYNNSEHLCKLSTFAINYLYLTNNFLQQIKHEQLPILEAKHLLEVGVSEFHTNIDLKQKYNLQLYYYTHCVIGASLFYSQKVNTEKNEYVKMLKICEKIIMNKYFEINIDNKVEFLVCAKLLNYKTDLFSIIYSECVNSLSDLGNYLVDKQNTYKDTINKNSFIKSEHRNVLFLMAFKK